MDKEDEDRAHAHRLTVFSVSSGMVGVCLTGIGLLAVAIAARRVSTWGDELLGVAATMFLISAALSFVSMRRREQSRWRPMDRAADYLFFLAMGLVLVVCEMISLWMD